MSFASPKGMLIINGKRHLGRVFSVNGQEIELYRIGTLCAALDKSPQAVILWEKAGLLPKPMFKLTGQKVGNCKRWYSKAQVINLYRLWRLIPYGRGQGHLKTAFFKALHANNKQVFYSMEPLPLKIKGVKTDEQRQRSAEGQPAPDSQARQFRPSQRFEALAAPGDARERGHDVRLEEAVRGTAHGARREADHTR